MKKIYYILAILMISTLAVKADKKQKTKKAVSKVQATISKEVEEEKKEKEARKQMLLNADTLNVEQIAFDYFLTKIDSFSFDAYSSYKFNKKKDRMFYTGITELYQDLMLGNFKTYAFKKKKFIDAGSFNDRNRMLSCEKEPRKINASEKYIVKVKVLNDNADRKPTDANIAISNRYYFDGYYYVRIKIDPGIDLVHTYFYAKINPMGEPENWIVASDIE